MTVDAIIPAHNEARTVAAVIKAVQSSSLVDHIFVVDDGSSDETSRAATAAGARVIRHAKCRGKAAALCTGVEASKADVFLFLDADLFRLTARHVERILAPVLMGERFMNIGLRDHKSLDWLVARLPLVSGQRALRREVFVAIPSRLMQGYGSEIALNAACRYHPWKYGIVRLPGLAVRRKFDKVGLRRAVWQYLHMWLQVLVAMLQTRLAHARGDF